MVDREHPAPEHRRPTGVSDETVAALGKLSEALEAVERARGHLYSFHQLIGHADLQLSEAADLLDAAGHAEFAAALRETVIGRNVIEGRWTFQIVEEFDDGFWHDLRTFEQDARDALVRGRRHLYEAEMKERLRTHGRRHHESRPDQGG